jgi:hypothetical protein
MASKDGGNSSRPETRDFTEFGSTGLRSWAGSIYEERLKELQGRKGRILLREMRLNDPVINAVFLALENNLRKASWQTVRASDKPVDREAADFLHQAVFEDMSFSWTDTFSFILTMLEQGFSVLELVYKKRLGPEPPSYVADPAPSQFKDGRIGWRKWAPRPAESLAPGSEWVLDETGGIQGINQQPETGLAVPTTKFIPIEKLLLFRTTVVPANNPEGLPIHRSMYIPWWYSNQIMQLEAIGVERDLAGIPVVYLGDDCTLKGANSDWELSKDLVVNLRNDEQSGVVFPHPKLGTAREGQGILLELLSSGGGRSQSTSEIITRYNQLKALSVLAQFIMLGTQNIGSYALSITLQNLFQVSNTAWLTSIADTINRHAVPRLFRMNSFPGMENLPRLSPGPIVDVDLERLSNFVNRLVGTQVIKPDEELERYLRQLSGLPEKRPEISVAKAAPASGQTHKERSSTARRYVQRMEGRLTKHMNRLRKRVSDPSASVSEAVRSWEEAVGKELEDAYRDSWRIALGSISEPEAPVLEAELRDARDYLHNFATELNLDLEGKDPEEAEETIGSQTARLLSYAGMAWAIYNLAKVFRSDEDEIWIWEGPEDEASCEGCLEEMALGERPLRSIRRFPGQTQCGPRCRHELIRVF